MLIVRNFLQVKNVQRDLLFLYRTKGPFQPHFRFMTHDEKKREQNLKQQFEELKSRPTKGHSHSHGNLPPKDQLKIPGIKHMVAVASGKGGVGKSTFAVNLALAFEALNLKIGLLDTDIYGPSVPIMMNLKGHRAHTNEKKLVPLKNYNIKCMSVGFLIPEDKPVIWRGPMVMSALQQMFHQVEWGEIDILVLDLPPGTGDTQITLSQNIPLSGAVIISTPQDLALADAIRGVNMFRTVNVPIIGIVENMSYYNCPKCGHAEYIFGDSGAEKVAQNMGIDFLGKIPLHTQIRETTDSGKPIVVRDPSSPLSMVYSTIAKLVLTKLENPDSIKEGPTIVYE